MRTFLEGVLEDMQAGRESWRVMTFLSAVASGIAALLLWT